MSFVLHCCKLERCSILTQPTWFLTVYTNWVLTDFGKVGFFGHVFSCCLYITVVKSCVLLVIYGAWVCSTRQCLVSYLGIDDGSLERIVIHDVSEPKKIKQKNGKRYHSILNLRVNQILPFCLKFQSFLL